MQELSGTSRSDFTLLWQRAGTGLENYASTALEIAIREDPAPILRALRRLKWPDGWKMPDDVDGVSPRTQVSLAGGVVPELISTRYLDLVLALEVRDRVVGEVWVEVKVAAGLHGDQIEAYDLHRGHRLEERATEPVPRLLLLSNWDIKSVRTLRAPIGEVIPVPWLSWAHVADAIAASIEASPSAFPVWRDFYRFLGENRIVSPPVGDEPMGGRLPFIGVLVAFNRSMRKLHPEETRVPVSMWWSSDGVARNTAERIWVESGEIVLTGQPFTYGLARCGDEWCWVVRVVAEQGVTKYSAAEIVAIADEAGLGPDWIRSDDPRRVLEKSVPRTSREGPDAAAAWLTEVFDDLRVPGDLLRLVPGL